MCVTPNRIEINKAPYSVLVGCRNCWQCRKNRVNDLVGRCIAESKYSSETMALTLTYRGETAHAATLVYSDFQKFLKRLRVSGYNVRYIVCGEYGTKKERAHWHAVLFFDGPAPRLVRPCASRFCDRVACKGTCHKEEQAPEARRFDWKFWGDGYSFLEAPNYQAFSYVLKYTLKEQEDVQITRTHLAMSKKPILGDKFITDYARYYVEQRLVPRNPSYSFSDVFDANGKPRVFWLQGRGRELFLERFVTLWRETYETEPPIMEWVTEFIGEHMDPDPELVLLENSVIKRQRGETYWNLFPEEPAAKLRWMQYRVTIERKGKPWLVGVEMAEMERQLRKAQVPIERRRAVWAFLAPKLQPVRR